MEKGYLLRRDKIIICPEETAQCDNYLPLKHDDEFRAPNLKKIQTGYERKT